MVDGAALEQMALCHKLVIWHWTVVIVMVCSIYNLYNKSNATVLASFAMAVGSGAQLRCTIVVARSNMWMRGK